MRLSLLLFTMLPASAFAQTNKFPDDGNVGIGTFSPVTKLHVQGTFFSDNTSTNQICLQNNGSYYGSIFTPGASKWALGYSGNRETLGTSVLTWTDGGNVGIGTTSPGSKLEVNTSADYDGLKVIHAAGGIVRLQSNSLQQEAWNDITRQGDAGIVFGHVNGPNQVNFGFVLAPWRGGMSGLRMDNFGNIAIGTYDPKGYKLAVNGDAIFTKVKVKQVGAWPDYVFLPAYKLPSLKDVEAYIQQNNHLPEVPSAAEVEKNGIELGDNQGTLLKKIEELTFISD